MSRLAEILGVEENEVFEFECKKYRIHGGERQSSACGEWRNCFNEKTLMDIINHPEKIKRLPRWTKQEVERAKAIKIIYPNAQKLQYKPCAIQVCSEEGVIALHPADLFPGIKSGRSYTLDEIIGEEGCR